MSLQCLWLEVGARTAVGFEDCSNHDALDRCLAVVFRRNVKWSFQESTLERSMSAYEAETGDLVELEPHSVPRSLARRIPKP